MATPTIQQGRLITKRSAIPGTVPTVPAVDDIETFIATDIFKGELFYNIPDNILYTRDNTGIVIISSGSPGPTYVYYTENTTPGSEEAKIEVIDGTDSSYVLTQPTQIEINSTDGTNTTTQLIASNNFNVISSDGTDDCIIDISFNALSLNSNQVTNDVVSKIDLDPANLASVNGTYIRTEQISTGDYSQIRIPFDSIVSESTDGTDTTIVSIEPNRIRNSINLGDPSNYEKEVNITTGVVSEQMITSGVGAYTNNVQASQYYFQLNNGAGGIKRIDLDNLSNYINIRSIDNTDMSEVIMSPTDIITSVTDGTDTTIITQTPTSISISGIGSYASDAAAGTAGLVAGDVYQTDGTGSGIFATPGILMVKQ
jgi:hypothetical protein